MSTIGGATAAHAAPVDSDAAKKLSTGDLGALTDQAKQAPGAAPVVTGDATRLCMAWAVSATRARVLSFVAASEATGAACAAGAPPIGDTSRPPAVATTAARRPAAAEGAAIIGRRAARCLPRMLRAVTFNLSV
ncbi:hypothetical protein V5O49_00285, partial [Isoptericola sp. MSP01]